MEIFNLTGKTAFITGAAQGLGEQFAHTLSTAGARIILADIQLEKITILAAKLKNAKAIKIDVSIKDSINKAISELEVQNERIDICINNAGIAKETAIFEPDIQNDFEKIIQVNVLGVWQVTKMIANHMKKNNIAGSIINIGSINDSAFPALKGTAYNISKAAVIHMTKSLVKELSQYNIRINCIVPGFFLTQMAENSIKSLGKNLLDRIPLNFIGNPNDLDGIILYLSSNIASRYTTGASITIDGGVSASTY